MLSRPYVCASLTEVAASCCLYLFKYPFPPSSVYFMTVRSVWRLHVLMQHTWLCVCVRARVCLCVRVCVCVVHMGTMGWELSKAGVTMHHLTLQRALLVNRWEWEVKRGSQSKSKRRIPLPQTLRPCSRKNETRGCGVRSHYISTWPNYGLDWFRLEPAQSRTTLVQIHCKS